jgi:glutamyl-Q tRNA(Asp) synthetase
MIVSRFAPTPTGRLHLGHAYSAVRAHDLARAQGGQFLLRIEDIDGTRSREAFVAGIEEDLRWLGLSWDGPVWRQSERMAAYGDALARLKAMGLVYPCFCTRAEIAASASAPHGVEGPVYPGTCRILSDVERAARMQEPHCWRLDMERAVAAATPSLRLRGEGATYQAIRSSRSESPSPNPLPRGGEGLWWHDASAGWIEADPLVLGDVVLARKETPTSYHLAVTIDDAAQGVTDVVRGVDLFEATYVHRLLQALLGLPTPLYHHHPLLTGPDGKRLAKRNGAQPLAELRAGGTDPAALLAALRAGQVPIGGTGCEA